MKNITCDHRANVVLNLPVPNGTLAGAVLPLGANGLKGITLTPQATTPNISTGLNAPGLAVGEASVKLIGVCIVANLAIAVAANQFDKIYVANDLTYNKTNTGTFVGYALATIAAPGTVDVALLP